MQPCPRRHQRRPLPALPLGLALALLLAPMGPLAPPPPACAAAPDPPASAPSPEEPAAAPPTDVTVPPKGPDDKPSTVTLDPPAGGGTTGPEPGGAPQDPVPTDVFGTSIWSRGVSRWFAAAAIDLGVVYLRPRVAFGHGQPHYSWIGVETNPILSLRGVGLWGGLRFAIPGLDLRVGARYFYDFDHSYLAPAQSYSRSDLDVRAGPRSTPFDLEAEFSWSVNAGIGELYGEHELVYELGVPEGYFVYDDHLRLIVDPPWAYRNRLGFSFYLGRRARLRVGPVLELAGSPKRGTLVWRAGLNVRMRLYDDLELRGTFVPVVAARDSLGLQGADAFLVGVRYRWATE